MPRAAQLQSCKTAELQNCAPVVGGHQRLWDGRLGWALDPLGVPTHGTEHFLSLCRGPRTFVPGHDAIDCQRTTRGIMRPPIPKDGATTAIRSL